MIVKTNVTYGWLSKNAVSLERLLILLPVFISNKYDLLSVQLETVDFFNLPNPSIMALGSTQPLTEMSTRDLPGGKGRG
jgi:hypothetical protein